MTIECAECGGGIDGEVAAVLRLNGDTWWERFARRLTFSPDGEHYH